MKCFLALLITAVLTLSYFTGSIEGNAFESSFNKKTVKFCITGDLIYPKGISSVDDPKLQELFINFYQPLTLVDNSPQVALLTGNHDYTGNPRVWLDVAKLNYWVLMPNRYYMEIIGGSCFYYLDTNIFANPRYILDIIPQLIWFQRTRFENGSVCKKEIVFSHHPYLSVGRHKNATGFMKFLYDLLIIDN